MTTETRRAESNGGKRSVTFEYRLCGSTVEYRQLASGLVAKPKGEPVHDWMPLHPEDWPYLSPSELRAIASLKEAV